MTASEPDRLAEVLGRRDVVVVAGSDAERFLHSQVSQRIEAMEVGAARWTFVLDPTGKIEGLCRVRRTAEERFELDTDVGWGQRLLDRLGRFKIRVAAELELVEGDSRTSDPIDEALRIEIGWPRLGVEIVPGETIPAGTGLVPITVDFTKGCYPGQELVERMDSRGSSAPRTLRRLDVEPGTPAGSPVMDGDEEVGVITTVAGGRALAWIKRSSSVGEPVGS
ncbi:MAG: YgfZ/GcvT domain-containing protein [Ilumatobacteraceae bacterium]